MKPKLLPEDEPRYENRAYDLIAAAKGDDYAMITNNSEYGIAYLAGMEAQGLKISWKDVNFSAESLSYAEAMILIPPNMRMHWEYTLRRNKGEDIPLILDPVVLKALTPVRKQVNLETDLPSKMRMLTTRAQWCNPRWITYDFHQHAVLIGLAIFDMEGSFQFPFLFEGNGGCGGLPPYGNAGTAHCTLYHHNRGGMTKSVLGIMREAVSVNACRLKPKDSVFLRWVYQAQAGDDKWLQAVDAYLDAKGQGYTEEEIYSLIKGEDQNPFPDELEEKLMTIPVENPLVGSAISAMRKQGILLTKLDVQETLANRQIEEAYYQNKMMGQVATEIKIRKQHARTQSLVKLRDVLGASPKMSSVYLDSIPDDHQVQKEIMARYYGDFLNGNLALSSLCYGDKADVIFSPHVQEFIGESGKRLLHRSIGIGIDSDYAEEHATSLSKLDTTPLAEQWVREFSRGEKTMPPVSFGPRDAHILLGIQMALETYERPIIVVVTSDRGLVNSCRKWAHYCKARGETVAKSFQVSQIHVKCLIAQAFLSNKSARKGPRLTNPWTLESFPMTQALEDAVRYRTGMERSDPKDKWVILYDEPNIVRTCAKMEIRKGFLYEFKGGGINADTTRLYEEWKKFPIEKLGSEMSFQRTLAKKVPMKKVANACSVASSILSSEECF